MKVGSCFSGIGGFDLGLSRVGMEVRWQIENEAWCNKILARHWPEVKRYGDITTVDVDELERVDLLCGGFPCQDLSVAGKRAGLAGSRSALYWEFLRLADALRPRYVLIENVPGLFSSQSGRDFAQVVSGLDELGYGVAWRVLDSQNFGVPQRRRRVFIVGHLGAPCPPEVLFEPESLRRDSPAGREAGPGVAGTLAAGAHPSGFNGRDAEQGNIVAPALRRQHDSTSRDGQDVAYVLRSRTGANGSPERGDETYVIQDARGTREKRQHGIGIQQGGPNASQSSIGATPALISSPADADGVREATGVSRRLDADHEPDSPRYRGLGNAVTVPVIEWIGRRIVEASA